MRAFEGQPGSSLEGSHQHIAAPQAHYLTEKQKKHKQRQERNLSTNGWILIQFGRQTFLTSRQKNRCFPWKNMYVAGEKI